MSTRKQHLSEKRRYTLRPRRGLMVNLSTGRMEQHIFWHTFDTETGRRGREYRDVRTAEQAEARLNAGTETFEPAEYEPAAIPLHSADRRRSTP